MNIEFDTTVLGGLPVTVAASFSKTSFAMNDPWADELQEWEIVAVNGRYCKKPPHWVYKRLTDVCEETIVEEAHEHQY